MQKARQNSNATLNVNPTLVIDFKPASSSMTDKSGETEESLMDTLSTIGLGDVDSSQSNKAVKPKASLGKLMFLGFGSLAILLTGLFGAHVYFNSEPSNSSNQTAEVGSKTDRSQTINANIAAIEGDTAQSQSNVQGNVQAPKVTSESSAAPDISNVSHQAPTKPEPKLTFSDPNTIVINEDVMSAQNVDPYVAALQELPAEQAQSVSDVQVESLDQQHAKQPEPKIVDVMEGVDIKALVDSHIRRVDASLAAHDVKIEGTQKAVTQTAQLIVELRSNIQANKKDVVQLRSIAFDNQDSIKVLEEKINKLEKAISESRVTTTGTTSTNQNTVQKPVQVANSNVKSTPTSNSLQAAASPVSLNSSAASEPRKTRPAIELSNFKVNAMVDNRAAISNKEGSTFPIMKGARYTNLGRVIEFDTATNDVYGEFDNGKPWVIRGAK